MDAAAVEDEEPIFKLASECEELFSEQVERLEEENQSNGAKVLREYQQRFAAWASFLGVFSGPEVCLDRRLRCHFDIQEQILRILDILERNLSDFFEPEPFQDPRQEETKNSGQGFQQRHQAIAPDSLIAIAEAVGRLVHLGKAIRQSPAPSQVLRARRFAESFNSTSFEQVAYAALKSLYADATQSLLEQLVRSMAETYVQFRYRQSRQESLRPRRLIRSVSKIEENGSDISSTQPLGMARGKNKLSRKLQNTIEPLRSSVVSEYAPTSLDSREARSKWRRRLLGVSGEKKTKSILSRQVDYPRPSKDAPICEWCFSPVPEDELEGEKWRQHVNDDHKPYVCISEDCAESTPRYASSADWFQHMINTHGQAWHQAVHSPPSWVCPLCDENAVFSKPDYLTNHIAEIHGGTFTEPQVQAIVHQGQLRANRAPDICPFCCFSMKMEQETISRKRDADVLLQEDSSTLTIVGENPKRIKTARGYSQLNYHNSHILRPPQENVPLVERTESSGSSLDYEAVSAHIAGHLQCIMLITLRILSLDINGDVPIEINTISGESQNESLLASLGQSDSELELDHAEHSPSSFNPGEDIGLDDDYSLGNIDSVPEAHVDWTDIICNQEVALEDDMFLQEAIASGAFQETHEEITQPTRTDDSQFSATEAPDDSDVWGYLIPLDPIYGDAKVLRSSKHIDVSLKAQKETTGLSENKPLTGPASWAGGYLVGRHRECVDLIDSMLVVDPGKRLTIDQCLAHPWLNYDERKPSDSTSGLVGGIAGLEISRRGQTRERTLISSLVTAQSKVQPEVGTDQGIIAGDATSQKDVFHATVEEES
ncbi:hypothetical protein S7711_01650 [Stachybotrys chartarum IBT 7711]|uniref:Protein kinase domain-containing protein n=1 Tax=Stachybotrys chartarum (strain CBS 109288 / IBT 7711) TaxID=1280523 RepID=A0A084AV62_STACB|nr:hypothetical protein S7711_01650 [Stachybotrys chartarum IBT 7711]